MHMTMTATAPGKNQLVDVIGNKSRLLILNSITSQPKYISQIVRETNLSRPTVCFHLGVLEQSQLVSSDYQVLEPPHSPSGKAARFYSINKPKLAEALAEFKKLASFG